MTDEIFVSAQGVHFTSASVESMRWYAKSLADDGMKAMNISVAFDADGALLVGLGGDFEVHPLAILDSVDGIQFYWHALPEGLAAVRKYCFHITGRAPKELIPLDQLDIPDA